MDRKLGFNTFLLEDSSWELRVYQTTARTPHQTSIQNKATMDLNSSMTTHHRALQGPLQSETIRRFSNDHEVTSDDLRDALSVIFGLSELKEISGGMYRGGGSGGDGNAAVTASIRA
ncbi:hypothetical protein Tco_1090123 [Tanacetum coccineum]|uniref:Uncharacterized protein n=1 Tax=Tanacetum coccineum TaxID=301880 RepID=A0ABQ5I4P7_9ASTR